MATVETGEVVFPLFLTLNRSPKNEEDLQELDDLLIRFEYVDDIKYKSDVGVEIICRVSDMDDFSQEEVNSTCDEIEKEVHEWEEKGEY